MAEEPITCENKKRTKNRKKENSDSAFSESEINAAEQLIQLSSDSDSNKNDNIDDVVVEQRIIIGNTKSYDVLSTTPSKDYCLFQEDDDQTTIFGFGPRKNKRFKSLLEIYSLTKPLMSIVN